MKRNFTIMVTLLLASYVFAKLLRHIEAAAHVGPSFCGYARDRIVVTFNQEAVNNFDITTLKNGLTGIAAIDAFGLKNGVSMIRQ